MREHSTSAYEKFRAFAVAELGEEDLVRSELNAAGSFNRPTRGPPQGVCMQSGPLAQSGGSRVTEDAESTTATNTLPALENRSAGKHLDHRGE